MTFVGPVARRQGMNDKTKPTRPGQSVRKLLPMSSDLTYSAALYVLLVRQAGRTLSELLGYFAPPERLDALDALNEMLGLGVVLEWQGRYQLAERGVPS
jgi:hypothetical protein